MPKLLFVTPSAYLLSGLATWLDYLEPGLGACGWDVTVGLTEGPRFHRPQSYLGVHPHRNWVAIRCDTGTREGRVRAIGRAIDEVRPDIVAAVNVPDVFAAVARKRAQGDAVRAVMTVHGIQAWLCDDIRRYRPWLDAVVCANRLACCLGETLGGMPIERLHYAPCGVEIQPFRTNLMASPPLRIVYSGRLEQDQKRIHDLQAIVAELDRLQVPFRLTIAGDGPEEQALRDVMSRWVAVGQVEFLGRLDADEVRTRVYPESDVLLVTSFWETGPIVIWEAMACGIPVVTSRYIGSGREGALRNGENCLTFDVGDANEAAARIAALAGDPALARRLGNAGRELVADRYTIAASVQAWDKAFRSTLELSPLPVVPPEPSTVQGRLDRWFGPGRAETLRTCFGRIHQAADPGGEWPHSYHGAGSDEAAFWQAAERADAGRD